MVWLHLSFIYIEIFARKDAWIKKAKIYLIFFCAPLMQRPYIKKIKIIFVKIYVENNDERVI